MKLHNKYYSAVGIVLLVSAAAGLSLFALVVQRDAIIHQLMVLEQGERFAKAVRYRSVSCQSELFSDSRLYRKVTNDTTPTPENYIPADLVPVNRAYSHPRVGQLQVLDIVQEPLSRMIRDGRMAGHNLHVNAGFRSYVRQAAIYRSANPNDIITKPERAARPGFSEHQLGVAVDISGFPNNDRASYDWLALNAPQYGFVLSYPKGLEEVTGYTYEPWHWRYVGPELAMYLTENGVLFNEQEGLFLDYNQQELSYDYNGSYLTVYKSNGKEAQELLSDGSAGITDLPVMQLVNGLGKNGNTVLTPTNTYDVRGGSRLGDGWKYISLTTDKGHAAEVLQNDYFGYIVALHDSPEQASQVANEVLGFCGVRG